jgi:uncharacterized protein YyaL (SSP411 family)
VKQASIIRLSTTGLALAGLLWFASCGGKSPESEAPPEEIKADVWTLPDLNRLGGLPGSVYSSQESSAIHWQPWTQESLEMARNSQRLLLAVIALPQQPSFAEVLKSLSSDRATVEIINNTYVPVLIDGDAVREMGILTADLCTEIGSGLQLPLMVWMTPEGNPVAWIPLPSSNPVSVTELFSQSHVMVARMWVEDSTYVSLNSKMDQGNRSQRLMARLKDRDLSAEPALDSLRALRQLTSLYDPLSHTFDEAGGLFPSGALDLLAMGATMEAIPQDLRGKCRLTLENLLADLAVSPMFDPLDGGVYNSRRGSTWALPGFYRDCAAQSRVVVSLLNAYEATGDKRALDRALGVLEFIEANYKTGDGLFRLGSGQAGDTVDWLWRYEDVKEILSEDELAVWIPASGMKEAGNLPSEVDPLREFFRANGIAYAKSAEEVSESLGLDPSQVKDSLDRARKKLLSARDKRLREIHPSIDANAVATFRVVSAYATAYRISGDPAYRELAAATLGKAKEHFSDGPRLKAYASDAADSLVAGRAFVYGLAIQAALDVEAVSLKGSWMLWAGDLSSTVAEFFSTDEYLRECPPSADLIGLPITDLAMLFDDSTAGLLSMCESQLDALGIPLLPSLKAQVSGLPMATIDSPILHTDLIQAALMREYAVTFVIGKKAPDDMKEAIARSPLKGVNRRLSGSSDGSVLSPEPDGALRIDAGGVAKPVRNVADINVPSLP